MENSFEKHIKNAMDNPPEFPFDEGLWNDMATRLDERDNKKPMFGFLSVLPFLLLTLIATGFAGYFYFGESEAKKRLAIVEQQLQNQNESISGPVTEKRVTVIYDTIYNRVVIDQLQERVPRPYAPRTVANHYNGQNNFSLSFGMEDFAIPDFVSDFSAQRLGVKPRSFENSKNDRSRFNNLKGNDTEALLAEDIFGRPVSFLPELATEFLNISYGIDLPAIEFQKRKRRYRMRYILHELRPTRFILSGTTGTFASLNLGSIGFNLRGSAHAEVGFGKRFSIITGIEYFANDFSKKINLSNDPFAADGFPDLPPNNVEDELTNIQGDFNYLQIPLGVKQIIFPRRYFYPYIAGGVIYGRTARSRLEYQYESLQGFYSVSAGSLEPRNFDLSAVWGTLGFQIQMNRNWSLLIEGSSQFDFKNGIYKYENLDLLKFNTGVQYKF